MTFSALVRPSLELKTRCFDLYELLSEFFYVCTAFCQKKKRKTKIILVFSPCIDIESI